MFSELARGKCHWDGTVSINEFDTFSYERPGLYETSSKRTALPLRSSRATSTSSGLRLKSSLSSLAYEQSIFEDNQILLPKTYLTRQGHLVLFTVVEDELFALVDSSQKDSSKANSTRNLHFKNVEPLSQFGSLEDFVLSVLDYQHKTEKSLYASAEKKVKPFLKQHTTSPRTPSPEDGNDVRLDEQAAQVIPGIIGIDSESDTDTAENRSPDDGFKDRNNNEEAKLRDIQESESLALPRSKLHSRGKLRSPSMGRKNKEDPAVSKITEYIGFHRGLLQHSISSNIPSMESRSRNGLSNTYRLSRDSIRDNDDKGPVFYDSFKWLGPSTPNSNLNPALRTTKSNFADQRLGSEHGREANLFQNGITTTYNKLMPFEYDDKRDSTQGMPAIVVDRRPSLVLQKERSHSASTLKDMENINLHPRISSSKPLPEPRALGSVPSAVSLTTKVFQQMFDISNDTLNGDLQILSQKRNSSAINREITELENFEILRDVTSNSTARTHPDRTSHLDSSRSKVALVEAPSSNSEHAPRQDSFLGNSEAERRLGLTSDDVSDVDEPRAHASRLRSFGSSFSSFPDESTDDGEDKILFSYIRSRYRSSSWNPMASFSYDEEKLNADNYMLDSNNNNNDDEYSNKMIEESERNQRRVFEAQSVGYIDYSDYEITESKHSPLEISVQGDRVRPAASSANRLNRSFSHDVPHNELFVVDHKDTQKGNLYRSLSEEGSRASSRATSIGGLQDILSIRCLSPALTGPSSGRSSRSGSGNIELHVCNGQKGKSVTDVFRQGESSTNFSTEAKHPMSINSANSFANHTAFKPHQSKSLGENTAKDILSHSPESLNHDLKRDSTFTSSLDTNASLVNSTPEINDVHFFNHNYPEGSTIEARSAASLNPRFNITTYEGEIEGHLDPADDRLSPTTMAQKPSESTNPVSSDNKSKIDARESVVVQYGLKNISETGEIVDPITMQIKASNEAVFIDSHVFGAQQLLGDKNPSMNYKHSTAGINDKDMSYEKHLIDGRGELEIKEKSDDQNNVIVKKGNEKRSITTQDSGYQQEMELKIDLKIPKHEANVETTLGSKKLSPLKYSQEDTKSLVDKDNLRLQGVGGNEANMEAAKIEELKVLLENNSSKPDSMKTRQQSSTRKRSTAKQKKKKPMPSNREKAERNMAEKTNVSPLPDLPKKMQTVETMIGGSADLDKPIVDNQERLSQLDVDDSSEYKIERQESFDNGIESEGQSPISKTSAIKTVVVDKVTDMDPEKKGAYPPSKLKKSRKMKKNSKKSSSFDKEGNEERLKYEEQMKQLKEKEIEQQKAREIALAKQRAIEEEKARYLEEERDAKRKEEEARLRLAEAKIKAKEERDAKRQADAEKRRQLVEQRREERRKKELEIAEKEKEAERLKHERERRATELREQREKLKEQERLEEELILEQERLEAQKREEEERRLEAEKIKKAQEELERLIEEREYREQLRRVAEAQEAKMRELEEQRLLEEQQEQQRINEERERLKRTEYLKLQAELQRQKEAERIATEQRQLAVLKASKRKAELIQRRECNLERMFDLKSKRDSQNISRAFTFTYFVHIPRSVWELPIGWNSKQAKSARRKDRPTSTSTVMRSTK